MNAETIKKTVTAIWIEMLQITGAETEADFFEVGGDSITAIRLVMRIEQDTGIKISMAAIFEYLTLELLIKNLIGIFNATHSTK
jgi:acyl carrier protein